MGYWEGGAKGMLAPPFKLLWGLAPPLPTPLHLQCGFTETGPGFKVSFERPEKRGIDLAIPGLVV